MKFFILLLLSQCFVTSSNAQTDDDSLFFFDYQFNYYSSDQSKYVQSRTQLNDTIYIVKSFLMDSSKTQKISFTDEYTIFSNGKLLIQRSYTQYGAILQGKYDISVEVLGKENGVYILNMNSPTLNIYKTVYSKVLVPICPINKTATYDSNGLLERVFYHEDKVDSIWNARGELITEFYSEVDSLPVLLNYPDLSFNKAISKLIMDHVQYPSSMIDVGISGKVFVSCIITPYGSVEHIEILRGVHQSLDNAALNTLRAMRIKTPARKDGEFVHFRYRVPITFINYH